LSRLSSSQATAVLASGRARPPGVAPPSPLVSGRGDRRDQCRHCQQSLARKRAVFATSTGGRPRQAAWEQAHKAVGRPRTTPTHGAPPAQLPCYLGKRALEIGLCPAPDEEASLEPIRSTVKQVLYDNAFEDRQQHVGVVLSDHLRRRTPAPHPIQPHRHFTGPCQAAQLSRNGAFVRPQQFEHFVSAASGNLAEPQGHDGASGPEFPDNLPMGSRVLPPQQRISDRTIAHHGGHSPTAQGAQGGPLDPANSRWQPHPRTGPRVQVLTRSWYAGALEGALKARDHSSPSPFPGLVQTAPSCVPDPSRPPPRRRAHTDRLGRARASRRRLQALPGQSRSTSP